MHIMFMINTICNYNCEYCVVKNIGFSEDRNLMLYDYTRLDDDIDYFNTLEESTIYITGGEPTLHPKFNDIVERILEETIHTVFVYSNASNIARLNLLPESSQLQIDVAYHSQYDDEDFMDKIIYLSEKYALNVVFIPYPKYLDNMKRMVDRVRSVGIGYRMQYLIVGDKCGKSKIHTYTDDELEYLKMVTDPKYYDNCYMDVTGKLCNCNSFFFKDGKLFNTCFQYEYTDTIERRVCTYENCACCINDIVSGEITLCNP